MLELEKRKCLGCGYEITIIPKFNGLYCNKYCCGCCPDAENCIEQNRKWDE